LRSMGACEGKAKATCTDGDFGQADFDQPRPTYCRT
jgi:hypothetical protein